MKQQILEILDKSTNNGMKADEIVSLIQEETFANLDEAAKYMVSVIAVKDMATVNAIYFMKNVLQEMTIGGWKSDLSEARAFCEGMNMTNIENDEGGFPDAQ